jgi:hypothetical protein
VQLDCSRAQGPTERYRYRAVNVSSNVVLDLKFGQTLVSTISSMTPPPIFYLANIPHRLGKCEITNLGSFDFLTGLQAHDASRWLEELTLFRTTFDLPLIEILEWIDTHSAVGGLRTLKVSGTTPSRELLATVTRCCPRLTHLTLGTFGATPLEYDQYDVVEACQILAPLRLLQSLELGTCSRINVDTTLDPPPATPSTLRSPVFPKLYRVVLACPTTTPDDAVPYVNWAVHYIPKNCELVFSLTVSDILRRLSGLTENISGLVEAGRNAAYENAFKDCTWWKLPSTLETMLEGNTLSGDAQESCS